MSTNIFTQYYDVALTEYVLCKKFKKGDFFTQYNIAIFHFGEFFSLTHRAYISSSSVIFRIHRTNESSFLDVPSLRCESYPRSSAKSLHMWQWNKCIIPLKGFELRFLAPEADGKPMCYLASIMTVEQSGQGRYCVYTETRQRAPKSDETNSKVKRPLCEQRNLLGTRIKFMWGELLISKHLNLLLIYNTCAGHFSWKYAKV